jgi:hypothetical protein
MMLKSAVLQETLYKFLKIALLFVLAKIELTDFDFLLGFFRPIISFLFAIKMITDSRIAFDADDSTPHCSAIAVFAFIDRCQVSNLWLKVFALDGMLGKIVFHCTAIAPKEVNLNFNLILGQAQTSLSVWTNAG